MKIIFMSTPEFGIEALKKINDEYEISLVVTQKDSKRGRGKKLKPSPIKEIALELGLKTFEPENINSDESIEILEKTGADIIVVVAYGQILKTKILNMKKYGCVNIHASLLPKLRGAAPINRAIINGDKKTGITIMKMNEGLDTGDMALKKEINIDGKDAIELERELSFVGADLIIEYLKNIENNNINFIKQDDKNATYAEKITKETGLIDFKKMTSTEIINLVRGLCDREAATTTYKGEKFKILKASFIKSDKNVGGKILDSNKKLHVGTIDGIISIEKLQFSGKKAMDIKSYLAGNSLEVGEILGG